MSVTNASTPCSVVAVVAVVIIKMSRLLVLREKMCVAKPLYTTVQQQHHQPDQPVTGLIISLTMMTAVPRRWQNYHYFHQGPGLDAIRRVTVSVVATSGRISRRYSLPIGTRNCKGQRMLPPCALLSTLTQPCHFMPSRNEATYGNDRG
jgi:hypothetical protein